MTNKGLFCIFATTVFFAAASSNAFAQTTGDYVFTSYAEFAIGGTWTTTIGDDKFEHTYRWIAGKKFAQLEGKGGVLPFVAMFGVDPETKKCTWWFYNEDGSLGQNVMTRERDGVWMLEGKGKGTKGETRYKGRISRIDDNTIEEHVIEFIANGEKQPSGTFTWKRQRKPIR